MKRKEVFFVICPLLALLVGVIMYEVQTGLILDVVVFPALLYFLVVSCILGSKPWWHYPLGLVAIFGLGVLATFIGQEIWHREILGGGAIKLLAAVGATLGIGMALQLSGVFAVSCIIALLIASYYFSEALIPSSPIILFSILIVLSVNFRSIKIEKRKGSVEPPENVIERERNDENNQRNKYDNRNPLSLTVIIIVVFCSFQQMVYGLFAARGHEPSGAFEFLSYIVLFSLVGYWLTGDNRRYKVYWVYDMGFFLYLAWPLIIPFYLFKTRGLKTSLLIVVGFIGIGTGAYIFGGLLGRFLFP
jgi:hypothetical protein